jgi:hypothetical protein
MATAFAFKSKSEQTLEWLEAESRRRPLTEDEQQQLQRSLHAVYMVKWRRG